MREVELLAPAGDLEKLKIAFIYGADAVYIGGEVFGMRSAAKNFSKEDMIEGVEFAHSMGKRVFVTVNIIPRSEDIDALTILNTPASLTITASTALLANAFNG